MHGIRFCCSKSLNKAKNKLIFGQDTHYYILNKRTLKKIRYQNFFLMYFIVFQISYVFLCFFNLFIFIVFSMKFTGDTFAIINSMKLIDFDL